VIELVPDITVVYQWVIFMIAFLVLHFGVFKPTLKILEARKSKTIDEKETALALNEKTEEMKALYNRRLEEARLEGIRKKDDLRVSGEKFVEDLLKKTRTETESAAEKSRSEIDRQSKEAALALRQQARDLGHEIAVKLLERNI